MSRKFREWKRFLKLFHNCGRDREHKATLYDYKKMRRKYQREWKNDMKIAHMWGLCLDCKPLTLARYKSCKRKEQRIDKDAKKFIRENWISYRHSNKKKRRKE